MDPEPLRGPVTLAVVEDHPVTVDGIRLWLSQDPGRRVELVASGPTVEAVLGGPGATADVLLLDLELDGVMIIDRVAELCAGGRRVVVFSGHREPETVLRVLDAGASAFLAKHESAEHCVDTIVAVATDRPYVTPTMARALISDDRPQRPRFSEREHLALLLWFQSMSKASVARRMGISEATVRQYIDRARVKYAKIGRPAPTKAALLARAIQDGLIRPEEVRDYRSFAAGGD
ncbi:DNA-binding NarL/FixJ family response regulator [Thermocatellispora tengchongensis]|uniref:DNA-binding NarL/FixJ family response regulator n=1 Tax=Thermocatellispora tengchongensis TaxID=1073253 RepID=A0A840NZE4_9ACTN|nr:response regulator [Thermocatellispora tengchongensis]MBB5132129.1 DNA-binding NarL/FixJ family response regulator [Thermocatellispora tengchongensis]